MSIYTKEKKTFTTIIFLYFFQEKKINNKIKILLYF